LLVQQGPGVVGLPKRSKTLLMTALTLCISSMILLTFLIDNNVVTMVSTIHTGRETVLRQRRRPRITQVNRNHIRSVWGNHAVFPIEIPGVIDDYNHWMLGVDKSDQLIAYYRPEIRCRRTWMPIMLHCLDVLRINAYIVYKELTGTAAVDHKVFVAEWIETLLDRATSESVRLGTRSRSRSNTPDPFPRQRRRISSKAPSLPACRLTGDRSVHLHVRAPDGNQRACAYCSYLRAVAKAQEDPGELPSICRVVMNCSACNVRLCKPHFDVYHGWEDQQE